MYESNSDKKKTVSVEEYFNDISPYLKNILSNLLDNDIERVLHSKTDNREIMINQEADEVIKECLIYLKIHIRID